MPRVKRRSRSKTEVFSPEWATYKMVLGQMVKSALQHASKSIRVRAADYLRHLADELDDEPPITETAPEDSSDAPST